MKLAFPSPEFDDAVAGVCHGTATEAQMRALNELLRADPNAQDEYLLRVELHTRLASDAELFSPLTEAPPGWPRPQRRAGESLWSPQSPGPVPRPKRAPIMALAACLILLAAGAWGFWFKASTAGNGTTSTAIAMLTRTVDAQWDERTDMRTGAPLEPGLLHLKSGLAQVVFYSGARMVIEGPAEVRLISPAEAACVTGRLLLEVPPPARGFRLKTPQMNVVDLGTSFGITANSGKSEVHVFEGKVVLVAGKAPKRSLDEGQAALVQASSQPRLMAASEQPFAVLMDFQQRSLAFEAYRYEQWQFATARLNQDPSLLMHLDFESPGSTEWTLRNTAQRNRSVQEAIVVGCARGEGRWREKRALEFQSVNDRVRFALPGEYKALTLSTWVYLKRLDRRFNSLFMSDGFDPGTVHWLIRRDGVLGLTVFGEVPDKFEILASPPVLSREMIGMWQHLAVVLDGKAQQVTHYLNGVPVSRHPLKLEPPFRIGTAELGNWNSRNGPKAAPELIRNLSGSMDHFALFSRALSDAEIRELHAKGKPDA